MSDSETDTDDPIGTIIEDSGYIDGMVTGWTLIVTFIDHDQGDPRVYYCTMQGQSAPTTLGHGATLAAIESAHLAQLYNRDDD